MNADIIKDSEFKQWLVDLKGRIRQSQLRAAVKVNSELLRLYWDLGQDIVIRQMDTVWGSGFYKQVHKELKSEFPDMHGFSKSNLYNMKKFYLFYTQENIDFQQVVGNLENVENKNLANHAQRDEEFKSNILFSIPWGHHIEIFTKCKSVHEALFYVQKTIKNGWSRAMLLNFMDVGLYQSQGKAINNFDKLLPDVQSDLARETLKDPYNFDFLTLTENYKEKELEDALMENITKFLLELGQGFAFVGRQYPIQIGNVPRNIDLLFYHLELRCYVVMN